LFSSCLFSFFFPPSDEKGERKQGGPLKREAEIKLGFWWIMEKLRKFGYDLFS